jgi:hypothetical protein
MARRPDRRSLRGVATFSSVTRQHVLQAIAEYDARGGEEFLELYGFEWAADHPLVHEGLDYDSRAILAVAHRYATGRLATPDEFHGGMQAVALILRKRGFSVSAPASSPRPVPVRTTRTPASRTSASRTTAARSPVTRRVEARETAPAICPSCSMTLPATGVCDYCS